MQAHIRLLLFGADPAQRVMNRTIPSTAGNTIIPTPGGTTATVEDSEDEDMDVEALVETLPEMLETTDYPTASVRESWRDLRFPWTVYSSADWAACPSNRIQRCYP